MISINVLSRTTPIESWIVDIPIKVEAVKSIEISLDSQMNKVLPNTEFALIYSIENKGNVDVRLYPSFILPQGIQTIEGASPFNLDIGESRIYILSLYAGQSAKTGQITMNLDNGSDRFSWNEIIEVEIFAKPSLEFTGLVYESGEQYSNYIGSGSHYAGQTLSYNWELSNLEDIDWTPEIEILSDDGLDVSCDAINTVLGLNDNVGLNCSVAIDSDVEPYSQPSFTLNMGGNGAQFSETISLYIAGVEEITWGGLSSNTFDTGEEKLIQIMATNTGNIPFNHRLEVTSEDDWDLVLDANDVVDLQVGESVLVRIKVTANEPGFSSIKLGFSSADSPQSSEFRFNVSATGESSDSFGSTGQIVTSVMLVIVVIAIIGMSIALLRSKKQRPVMPLLPRPVAGKQFSHTPMPLPKNLPQIAPPIPVAKLPITTPTPEIKQQVVEEVQTPLPICWSCRNPIDGAVLGCPSCGARYHGEGHESCNISNLEKCVSCSGTTSDFIDG